MSFVCNSCNFVVKSTEQRAEHYRSYWHRYNLKRQCEGLEPVAQDIFEKKLAVLTSRSKDSSSNQPATLQCQTCKKNFGSKKSYEHHMKSKRHLQKVANRSEFPTSDKLSRQNTKMSSNSAALDEMSEDKEPSSDTQNLEGGAARIQRNNEDEKELRESKPASQPVPLAHCLFCGQGAANLEECLRHMLKAHSFYLPYAQYLVSLEAIMVYLGEKVGVGNQCLYCNHLFKDIEAVRQHMRDVSHCKLSFEDEQDVEEYQEFFKVPDKDGDGKEVDDTREEGDDVVESKALSTVGGAPEGVASEVTELGEIVMKDGRVIGHRSLARYYKQVARH